MILLLTLLRRFQFHKGSIKTISAAIGAAGGLLFQFHKGSIKTAPSPYSTSLASAFQFHKGSIKTSATDVVNTAVQ